MLGGSHLTAGPLAIGLMAAGALGLGFDGARRSDAQAAVSSSQDVSASASPPPKRKPDELVEPLQTFHNPLVRALFGAKPAAGLAAPLPEAGSAAPFHLPTINQQERARAVECLTAAVYYEAANEPIEGQEAVAQVVINRVRRTGYPKSVCGVVFQGSERSTGCQFTFTCDGSMYRRPVAWKWGRARAVAEAALNGHIGPVGSATHYHADYVSPYWSATLVKVGQIGAHIFYRSSPWSDLWARRGGYLGGERTIAKAAWIGRSPAAGRQGPREGSANRMSAPREQVWGTIRLLGRGPGIERPEPTPFQRIG